MPPRCVRSDVTAGGAGGRERQSPAAADAGQAQRRDAACPGRHRRQGARSRRQAAKLILEELHHRIKNTLATVGAIASQSLRNAPSTQHAQHAIEGRLLALGRAHDLLLQARWTGADLRKIVHGATEPFDNPDKPRFSIAGPDVQIASGAVIAIAMTLNELCTNTTKFGALSVPAGHVAISWAVDAPASRLHFTWKEKDGPVVTAPTRTELWHPPDRDARPAAQGQCQADLRAEWLRLLPRYSLALA